jgi:hypothetical protein
LIKVLCFRGQKRAVHFFTVSFTENQTCLGESAQGEEFSKGLKAVEPRVLGRVIGVIDKEVRPFTHDAQESIPSGVINGHGRRIFFAQNGNEFIVGWFGWFVLEGGGREGEGKESEEKEKGKATTKERAKVGGFKPPSSRHCVFLST